jgi:hypothetical protein
VCVSISLAEAEQIRSILQRQGRNPRLFERVVSAEGASEIVHVVVANAFRRPAR